MSNVVRIVRDLPPHDIASERAVLASCVTYPELLRSLALSTADFYGEAHRTIWSALQFLDAEGHGVDTARLAGRLRDIGKLQIVGGDDFLLSLTDTIPLRSPPAERVRKLAQARAGIAAARRVVDACASANLDEARRALESAQDLLRPEETAAKPLIEWRRTDDIFKPLPPTKWLVTGLQLCAGRPAQIQGYGASAKTLSAQALALAVASGRPAWGHFEATCGSVRHLDYEQGWQATARRYQRLAIGHSIDPQILGDRLKLAVFPSVYLDSPNAVDAYSAACEGADLVILDALRGATPSHDENDSKIRACLDNLTRVSEKTGTAFLVLHHAGKPREGATDARTIGRGSSAIFDASGCILAVMAGKTKGDPRAVSQIKQPAEAEGGGIEDFTLSVEDVSYDGNPTAGVRVVYGAIAEEMDPEERGRSMYERDCQRILAAIRANPGASTTVLIKKMGSMKKQHATDLLKAMTDEGRVALLEGPRGTKSYRIEAQ